jgi:hypothetical protein
MKITYHYFDSKTQEREARAAMKIARHILPSRLANVRVMRVEPEDESDVAGSCSDPSGREAEIHLYNKIFEKTPAEQALVVLHECVHIEIAPMTAFLEGVIDLFREDNPKLYESLTTQHTAAMEAVVEDLTRTIGKIMGIEDDSA